MGTSWHLSSLEHHHHWNKLRISSLLFRQTLIRHSDKYDLYINFTLNSCHNRLIRWNFSSYSSFFTIVDDLMKDSLFYDLWIRTVMAFVGSFNHCRQIQFLPSLRRTLFVWSLLAFVVVIFIAPDIMEVAKILEFFKK